MIERFLLPDLGEGLTEAELVRWAVEPGEHVELNQTIAEVETAKAIVELPSPYAGTVRELHAEPGQTVAVGAALLSFEVGGADAAEPTAPGVADDVAPPNLVGYGAAASSAERPHRRARVGAAASGVTASANASGAATRERPRATPVVRAIARELGIDLAGVVGTGPRGRILRTDLDAVRPASPSGEAPASGPAAVPATAQDASGRTTRHPIRGVRKATAEAMVRSAFSAPHATLFLQVDATAAVELVASLRAERRGDDPRIGLLAVVAKGVCLALRRFPSLNSRWDEPAGVIVEHHYVNLGIAVATDRGLIVPNVPDADALGLAELAGAIDGLATRARAGATTPAALAGGTFTITNIGVFGVDAGTPILNPGEAGILALGAVRRQPWEHRGEIALRDVVTLALSFDHRVVDGQQGAQFLAAVGAVLREPGRAMLLA